MKYILISLLLCPLTMMAMEPEPKRIKLDSAESESSQSHENPYFAYIMLSTVLNLLNHDDQSSESILEQRSFTYPKKNRCLSKGLEPY